MHGKHIKKAFTLVELLVVISIIALLLSVLMPALSKAREAGRSAVCKSNLKTLALASLAWAANNNDWSPCVTWSRPDPFKAPFEKWSNPSSLQSYTNTNQAQSGKVYTCPSAKFVNIKTGPTEDGAADGGIAANKRCTYGINGWMACAFKGSPYVNDYVSPGSKPIPATGRSNYDWEGPSGDRGDSWGIYNYLHGSTKMMDVRRASETMFFMDHEFQAVNGGNFNPLIKSKKVADTYAATRWHEKKSGQIYGYANISWADGHASKEPTDFALTSKAGVTPRYCYYLWNH